MSQGSAATLVIGLWRIYLLVIFDGICSFDRDDWVSYWFLGLGMFVLFQRKRYWNYYVKQFKQSLAPGYTMLNEEWE